MGASFLGQLAQSAVVVQPGHGMELTWTQAWGAAGGDQGVSVGWVADDQHLHIASGIVVQCFALRSEDSTVGGEQVLAFHSGAAWPGADEHGEIGVSESSLQVIGGDYAGQQRESAIIQLHHDTLQGL